MSHQQKNSMYGALSSLDKDVFDLLQKEEARQRTTLKMIPSENYVSKAVLQASASIFTNKYSEGYPGKRYYEGQQYVDVLESLCIQRAKNLFGVDHANVQPYSGSPANLAVYFAFCEPGDSILGMGLPMGGHLTHGWPKITLSGKYFRSLAYGVTRETGLIDMNQVWDLAKSHRPKIIWCGGSAYPRTIDFASFADVARSVGAVLVADVAHISGLIAGRAHPSFVGHADVVTTTTHKTLRGPRGGMILCSQEHAQRIDRAVFPGVQGGPHNHTTAALAVALYEASLPDFSRYAHQVVKNAKRLAHELIELGYDLVSGGTDNHLILVDLTRQQMSGKQAASVLDMAGIETNCNSIPYDTRKPMDPSGVRLGTPAVTSRGLTEDDMVFIAKVFHRAIQSYLSKNTEEIGQIKKEVEDFLSAYPVPGLDE